MRETDFIGQNKKKWSEFEQVLNAGGDDAERLSRLFIEVTDDLSYSRTFYPNRSVRVYLNGLAQQVYHRIYRKRDRNRGAFSRFWAEELPDALWHARKQMLGSFLVFVLGFLIGILSSAYDGSFVSLILGDSYVAMTERNIAEGNPMGVYGSHGAVEAFLYIAWNNIRVGFLCFLMGVLFEIGSIFIVFSNAIMVGAFIWFFVQRDLFRESFLAIMQHGTLELSMIVLAGAAGMTLGSGLVFPGTYSRLQAFLMSARRGIRIMLGVSAFLLVAAFIEGFATRFTDAPNLIRIGVIAFSLILIIGYFVWYPYRRYRQGLVQLQPEEELLPANDGPIKLDQIKKAGQLIYESWRFYSNMLRRVLASGLGLAAAYTLVLFAFFLPEEPEAFFDYNLFFSAGLVYDLLNGFWFWDEANNFFAFYDYPSHYLLMAGFFGLLLTISLQGYSKLRKTMTDVPSETYLPLVLVNGLTAGCILLAPFFLSELIGLFFITIIQLVWWPFWIFQLAVSHESGEYLLLPSKRGFKLLKGRFLSVMQLFWSQGFVLWAAMAIVGAPLFYLVFNILGSNISSDSSFAGSFLFALHTFFMLGGLGVLFPALLLSFLLQTHSNREVNEANDLRSRLQAITFKKQAYGLEKDL